MKIAIIFLLAITIAFAQKTNMTEALEKEAIASLTQETESVIKQYANTSAKGLLSNATGQTGAEFWTCAKSEMNATLNGLPQKVIDQFNNVAFSSSTEFESFSSSLKSNYSYVYELIGTAKANSTDVAIGIAYVSVLGTTIQQYNVTKECNKCWIVKTCCKNVSTPIGFTTPQQDQMIDFLTEIGYQYLLKDMPKLVSANNMEMEILHHYKEEEEYD